jgi:hypothetical protein
VVEFSVPEAILRVHSHEINRQARELTFLKLGFIFIFTLLVSIVEITGQLMIAPLLERMTRRLRGAARTSTIAARG